MTKPARTFLIAVALLSIAGCHDAGDEEAGIAAVENALTAGPEGAGPRGEESRRGRAPTAFDNPIIKTDGEGNPIHTADPAALVWNDTVYLYTGHDEAPLGVNTYVMREWRLWTSTDLVHWNDAGSPLDLTAFAWATADAWAAQVVHRPDEEGNDKFYFYVPVFTTGGRGIGVAVADSPTGPFVDVRGSALITNDMTPTPTPMDFDDIDPSVFVDDDGQAYLYWGNTFARYVKLQRDMIHIEGEVVREDGTIDRSGVAITDVPLVGFTEAPWLHKRRGTYYLSYATGFPERIAYSTSTSPEGPWSFGGVIADYVPNSNTVHQAIIDFKGESYFFYHNGALADGGSFRRSVCLDRLRYNRDGTIEPVVQTARPTQLRRLQSFNFPLRYAHVVPADATARIDEFTTPFAQTQWTLDAGLADPSDRRLVSFQSVSHPGQYLHDAGDAAHTVRVGPIPSDPAAAEAFRRAATFRRVPGLADTTWSSFRSFDDPTRYLRHFGFVLFVQTPNLIEDATFRIRP